MTIWALVASMFLYLVIAYGNYRDKDYPHMWLWIFYACAQGTMVWYEFTKKVTE